MPPLRESLTGKNLTGLFLIVKITSKGQVTIPQAIREELGLLPNTEVEFVVKRGSVLIRKVTGNKKSSRGARAVQRLRGRARGSEMSTEEIMRLTRGEQ